MRKIIDRIKGYFTRGELALWGCSVLLVTVSFMIFDRQNYMILSASLTGVTYLILSAKGNPLGQALGISFSLLYGVISYRYAYYGEMITYLGMTMPMAAASLISWLKNPFGGKRSEVTVGGIGRGETVFMILLTAAVTAGFFFILRAFGTKNLLPSTVSVTTGFAAVYLTFRRDPFFAAAYAANDIVLIILWSMASTEDSRYIAVTICFAVFFVNDIYTFINWRRIKARQTVAIQRMHSPTHSPATGTMCQSPEAVVASQSDKP